jgi:phage terminase large subunit GpA-like protein
VSLAEGLRAALTPVVDRIHGVVTFGSVAKRRDTASSDVDLWIVSVDLTCADLYGALEGRRANSSGVESVRPSTLVGDWPNALTEAARMSSAFWISERSG